LVLVAVNGWFRPQVESATRGGGGGDGCGGGGGEVVGGGGGGSGDTVSVHG